MNAVEGSGVYTNWVESWNEQLEDWEADVTRGSSMASWINFFTEKDLIGLYYICKTPEEVHAAMDKGHYVWTGSKEINRTETKKAPYKAVYWGGSAHFFAIAESDSHNRDFQCVNSYWRDVYDGWHFTVERDDLDKLYTCVAFIDKQDVDSIQKIENRLEKVIKERWFSAYRQIIKNNRPDLSHAEKLKLWEKLTGL